MATTLTPEQTEAALQGTGFRHRGDRLEVRYRTPDFVSGMRLLVDVAALAERLGHHPEVGLGWGRLNFDLSSHDAGGVTQRDLDLATGISELAEAAGVLAHAADTVEDSAD